MDHYSKLLHRVDNCIEEGIKCIEFITKPNDGVSEIQTKAQTLKDVFNDIKTEFHAASAYVHPGHKKVELLMKKVKEIELSVPTIIISWRYFKPYQRG